jgi:hypothetical protein
MSDVIAEDGLDTAQRTAAEQRVGCTTGTLTTNQYEAVLASAGFTDARITTTNDVGGGLHSAIIQAVKPALDQAWARHCEPPGLIPGRSFVS